MLRYGFFDSEITGYDDEGMPIFDRAESSDFLAMFISKIISDGVLADPGDCFQVVAHEGMILKVRPGFGIIRGRFAMDIQDAEIEIPTAPTDYKRIDRVILRANYLHRKCEIIIREGTPAERPVPPELLQPASGDYYELCLAMVSIDVRQKTVTQSNITDTRYDSRVCGVVTQLINHLDTSVFFAQLNAFYEEFVSKSNASYAEFEQMALEAYQKFDAEIVTYINTLKQDGSEAYESMLDYFEHLAASGQQKHDDFSATIQTYITALEAKGHADLAKITQQLLDFRNEKEADFLAWFARIKEIFGTDFKPGDLQNQLDGVSADLSDMMEMLYTGMVAARLGTSDGDYIITDIGEPILVNWPICSCKAD